MKKQKITTEIIRGIYSKMGKLSGISRTYTKKTLIYMGRELEFINFLETRGDKQFCDIKFKDSPQIWTEDYNRLNYIWIEKPKKAKNDQKTKKPRKRQKK